MNSEAIRGELSSLRYGCSGIVYRDGWEDACQKPATCLIDATSQEDGCIWAACTYHAHRYGRGNVVPLAEILAALREPTGAGASA